MTVNKAEYNEKSKEIFEWVTFKDELSVETGLEKFLRKFKENPLVPIGALATVGCLSYGLYSFKRGDARMSQIMMRARVAAQGFTLAALVGGVYFASFRSNANQSKDK